jgi:hypothetical protein
MVSKAQKANVRLFELCAAFDYWRYVIEYVRDPDPSVVVQALRTVWINGFQIFGVLFEGYIGIRFVRFGGNTERRFSKLLSHPLAKLLPFTRRVKLFPFAPVVGLGISLLDSSVLFWSFRHIREAR